ncbi:MAG: diaminopimelate epimerase [Candidatus Eremiobacteraeota bacterium]|nr:diaminopimelate epimerase [Candidatus Eremiobacteraeota bacterium]
MAQVPLSKLHGTYNDFVVLDQRSQAVPDVVAFARHVCNRRAAIGADGLLVILPSKVADARMRIINADGSEAEMCGNGVRCVARFLNESGEADELKIETVAGIIETRIISKTPTYTVRVNMGTPRVQAATAASQNGWVVSMGNPHVVIFSEDDIEAVALPELAEEFQKGPTFPSGTNVHIARVTDAQTLQVRHWERGVGLTLACGTGAVACAAVAVRNGTLRSPVDVHVPGGKLLIEWDGLGDAFMSGPAIHVFDTTIIWQ